MDTKTVIEVISRLEIARNYAKEDDTSEFKCETTREYRAFVKGQRVALDAVINHFQQYVEQQVDGMENQSPEQ